jgi:hypothetical protein
MTSRNAAITARIRHPHAARETAVRVACRCSEPTMMKTCSHCQETVRVTARKCQFCGFRFDVTPSAWPARVAVAAVAAFAGGTAITLTASAWLALPLFAVALVLFIAAAFGARANTRRMFRSSGALPALRCPPAYCCPACSPV